LRGTEKRYSRTEYRYIKLVLFCRPSCPNSIQLLDQRYAWQLSRVHKETPMIDRPLWPTQPKPVSHYCHVVRADKHVWVSGSVGINADGSIPEGTVEQFRVALASVDACLRHAGATAAQVV